MNTQYTKIVLPTRAQPDTVVAIFILKTFGEGRFPGIKTAAIEVWQVLPEDKTEATLDEKGIVLMDMGEGRFDHHDLSPQTTASELVATYLNVNDDPALQKLLEYTRRDDFYGKGIISPDPIDRALGLSGLIASLNRQYPHNPSRVVELVLPILEAHYAEEVRRTKELPEEFKAKLESGEAEAFEVKQRDKKLRVIFIESDNVSLPGYLRSQNGGRFDIITQRLSSGHVNILTRPTKHPDLRSLAVLIRIQEATRSGKELRATPAQLAQPGRHPDIPQWYFDPATNSLQNGGVNPQEVIPTKIARSEFISILKLGLSEEAWSPR